MYGFPSNIALKRNKTDIPESNHRKCVNIEKSELKADRGKIIKDDVLEETTNPNKLQNIFNLLKNIDDRLAAIESVILKKQCSREHIPFFIREDYIGKSNVTILNDSKFEMTIEIIGLYSEVPIIYPFGNNKISFDNLPKIVEITCSDIFLYGHLQKNENGIYVMKLSKLYSPNENKPDVDDIIFSDQEFNESLSYHTLPLIFQCTIDIN